MFKKMKENKGFTLAELLVVVAIIGVLVAVSIPIFTGQLEKSRDAVTVANLRSAYAEAQTAYMTETNTGNATYAINTNDDSATVTVTKVVAKGKKAPGTNDKAEEAFSGLAKDLPFINGFNGFKVMDGTAKAYTVTFTYDKDGKITAVDAN